MRTYRPTLETLVYGIYLLEAGNATRVSSRAATRFHEGRAFKMHDLPINYDGRPSEEVFTVRLGSQPPQLVTVVPLEVNGVILEPGDKIRLRPPINLGEDRFFHVKIEEYEFDIVVFKYELRIYG